VSEEGKSEENDSFAQPGINGRSRRAPKAGAQLSLRTFHGETPGYEQPGGFAVKLAQIFGYKTRKTRLLESLPLGVIT